MSSLNKKTYWLVAVMLLLLAVIFVIKTDPDNMMEDYSQYLLNDYQGMLDTLARYYDINIDYNSVDDDFLDKAWRGQPANGTAGQISNFELARYSLLLPRLLSRYPVKVIHADLQEIKLSDSLRLFNTPYAGTSIGSTLYLTSSGIKNGYSREYIAQLFHHEMSSVLMRKHGFPEDEWRALNPSGFNYAQKANEILRAVAEDIETTGNAVLYGKGFLSNYSMSTLENDMNLYAEMLFTNPEYLAELVNTYPKIKEKYLILKRFYLGIDAGFADVFEAGLPPVQE